MLTREREVRDWKLAVVPTDKGALSSRIQRSDPTQALTSKAVCLGVTADLSQMFVLQNLRPNEAQYLDWWVQMRVFQGRVVTSDLITDALCTYRNGN